MNFTFANDKHFENLKMLWKECFFDDDAFIDWNFANRFKKENTIVNYDEDNLLKVMAQIIPYTMVIGGSTVPVGYIEGVATSGCWRKNGYGRSVVVKAFEVMKQRNQIFSFLVPFNYRFYEKLGFITSHYFKTIEFSIKEIEKFDFLSDDDLSWAVSQWEKLDFKNEKNILNTICVTQNIYDKFIENMDCVVKRTSKDFKFIFEEAFDCGNQLYAFDKSDNCKGYILYSVKDGIMDVGEFIYTDHEAFLKVMAFIFMVVTGDDNCISAVKLILPHQSFEEFVFSDFREAVSQKPFAMSRIIDCEAVLKIFSKRLFAADSIKLKICDDLCPWNDGIYEITKNNVTNSGAIDFNVCMNTNALTALVCGTVSPKEGTYFNMYSCDEHTMEILVRMFFKTKSYVNMLFN